MKYAITAITVVAMIGGPAAAGRGGQAAPNPNDLQKLDEAYNFVRARNARDYAITAPNGIDEGKYVEVGGIQQWITIRGEDRGNPVVLFVHGGPGDATNPWGYAGFRLWLKRFTVVQWDQRGTGRTLGKNRTDSTRITVNRLVQDGVELAEMLRTSLGKQQVLLIGHSLGSIIGALMAKARPDLFQAFVGTGQVGDPSRTYFVAYDDLIRKATALGDQQALKELRDVGPPPYADGRGYGVQRKWANWFEGADRFIASMVGFAFGAPGYTARDILDWFDGQRLSAETLVSETSALDAKALGGDFKLPVFVIQGAEDFTTPTSLARSFIESIRAPRKAFITIDGGHFAVFMKPQEFVDQLVSRVLPAS